MVEHSNTRMSNGVTSLMYVGDVDDATDRPSGVEIGVGVFALATALLGKGVLQLLGMIGAGYMGYRWIKK